MLFLLFQLGPDWYALDTAQVAEVLPLVAIKQVPQAPRGIAGMFSYRGLPMPALDLSALAFGTPAQRRLSTRIVVVHYADSRGLPRLLGLIAEKATEAIRREPADFVDAGVRNADTPWLGPVASDPRGLIQWVQAQKLLPDAVRDALFGEAAS